VTNQFPDDTMVLVKFPASTEEEQGPRDSWSWLPGWVIQNCGEDEWHICVEYEPLGRPDQDGELTYPACFRDSSEIRELCDEP
jgi:hypothetical protein